jgi:peptide deformylase
MYKFVPSDSECLSNKIAPVKKLTKNHKEQIKKMKKMLLETPNAVAISANQIGLDLRAFVCKNYEDAMVVINPKIIWTSKDDPNQIIEDEEGVTPKSHPMWEGCLSFPGKNYLITRPYSIKVEYMNEKEKYKTATLTGQWARLFCHEIDHLDGIRVIDRAEEVMDIENEKLEE